MADEKESTFDQVDGVVAFLAQHPALLPSKSSVTLEIVLVNHDI